MPNRGGRPLLGLARLTRTRHDDAQWSGHARPEARDIGTSSRPAEAVAALKAEHPRDLISYGCGELANHLARRGLVDEVRFWLHPVVWGDGVRPFHAGELPIRMRLIAATTFTEGVVKLSYEPQR
jgi:dihydrofolate reductase